MNLWKLSTWNLDRKIVIVMIENEKPFDKKYQSFDKRFKIVFSHESNE